MKWYQKKKERAMERYQSGYYPRHPRTPNLMVCALYELGYLIADFGPMCVNLFNAIYTNTRKLFAFIVGLLIELSTVIVLIGTIAFSVFHSIELLRKAGATGGLEYIGVLMFEVVFISSTATLTGTLMKKKKPRGFFAIVGLIFSIAGFIMGIAFVEWSNITGMADSWTGRIIGGATPVLLIIAEGVLAFRYLNEFAEEDESKVMEIIQRNRLTVEDVRRAIQLYLNQTKKTDGKVIEDGVQNGVELNKKMDEQATKKVVEPTIQITTQNDQKTTTEMDELSTEKMVEPTTNELVETPTNQTEKQPEEQPQPPTNETTTHPPIEMDEELPEPTTFEPVESMESTDNQPVEETEESTILESEETTIKFVEQPTKEVVEISQENNHQINQSTNHIFDQITNQNFNQPINQNSEQTTNQLTNQISEETTNNISDQNNQPSDEEPPKKTTKRKKQLTRKRTSSSTEKMKKAARKWALEFYRQKGELPGRTRVQNGVGCSDYIARQTLEELKEELGIAS